VVQPLHRSGAGTLDGEELWEFFGVYDGHGGRAEVDHVEAQLHGTVLTELLAAPGDTTGALVSAFKKMDSQLAMMGAWNSGCTATVALVMQQGLSRVVHVANVGDSRAVLVSPSGDSRRVSRDHRAADPDEARRVSEEGGFVRFGRVGGALSVSRSLGDHNLKGAGVSCIPDVCTFPVADGEALLVASDGFWDALSDDDAGEALLGTVRAALASGQAVTEYLRENTAKVLVRCAKERGSRDNILVLVIFF